MASAGEATASAAEAAARGTIAFVQSIRFIRIETPVGGGSEWDVQWTPTVSLPCRRGRTLVSPMCLPGVLSMTQPRQGPRPSPPCVGSVPGGKNWGRLPDAKGLFAANDASHAALETRAWP